MSVEQIVSEMATGRTLAQILRERMEAKLSRDEEERLAAGRKRKKQEEAQLEQTRLFKENYFENILPLLIQASDEGRPSMDVKILCQRDFADPGKVTDFRISVCETREGYNNPEELNRKIAEFPLSGESLLIAEVLRDHNLTVQVKVSVRGNCTEGEFESTFTLVAGW